MMMLPDDTDEIKNNKDLFTIKNVKYNKTNVC